MAKVTTKTLASELGLARSTVTMALGGDQRINIKTRKLVLETARRLNYVPNGIASSLATRKTQTVGLVAPSTLAMPHISQIREMYTAIHKADYLGLLGYTEATAQSEARCIQQLRSRLVEGFLVLATSKPLPDDHFRQLIESRVPLVAVGPFAKVASDCVRVNLMEGFRTLTRHMIELGHKRVGLVILDSTSVRAQDREAGFKAALRDADLPMLPSDLIRVDADAARQQVDAELGEQARAGSNVHAGYWAVSQMFANSQPGDRPTAIVCASDEMAIGAMHAAERHGLRVPADLAVAGFDDLDVSAHARTPLTTMRHKEKHIASEAVKLLLRRIEGDWDAFPQTIWIQPEMVVRASCGTQG